MVLSYLLHLPLIRMVMEFLMMAAEAAAGPAEVQIQAPWILLKAEWRVRHPVLAVHHLQQFPLGEVHQLQQLLVRLQQQLLHLPTNHHHRVILELVPLQAQLVV
jgi:hypothetical protein